MGQYFLVMNMDKRQKTGSLGKLGEFLFSGYPSSSDFVEKFRVWSTSDGDAFLSIEEACETDDERFPAYSGEIGAFANLPVEAIHEICLRMENLRDVAFFSLTCQSLWEIGREHVNSRIAEVAATCSCAGDRIVCVGDYLENDDLPEGLLTQEEQEEFSQLIEARTQSADEYEAPVDNSFWYFPCAPMTEGQFDLDDYLTRICFNRQPQRSLNDAGRSYMLLYQLRNPNAYNRPPPAEPSILRNLSRHQYVREAALCDLKEKYAGTEVRMGQVNLGEILMMRICFSSDPTVSTPWDGGIHRGVWAGNRFNIVAPEWLETCGAENTPWTDVTNEVLAEFEAIWHAEYPYYE
ncbi:hypothetical protein C8R44DRAFT_737545 [Mycena epipterygia]|nr:hypothetical protein C8R44DRAFT_737545 [Mycena epipterygia]